MLIDIVDIDKSQGNAKSVWLAIHDNWPALIIYYDFMKLCPWNVLSQTNGRRDMWQATINSLISD